MKKLTDNASPRRDVVGEAEEVKRPQRVGEQGTHTHCPFICKSPVICSPANEIKCKVFCIYPWVK